MSLADWLAEFRGLHQRAASDQLSPPEWVAYRQGREELARALLAAQRLSLKPGETPRQALRVARALQDRQVAKALYPGLAPKEKR